MRSFQALRVSVLTVAVFLTLFAATAKTAMAAQFSAHPFIASDRADTTDFKAGLATGPGTPFSVSTNTSTVPNGTYAGVLVTPNHGRSGFQSLTFLLNGSDAMRVTVRYRAQGRSAFDFASLSAKAGVSPNHPAENGFQSVSLDARQFGIPAGSQIDKIVISPDPSEGAGSFLVNDIRINGSLVAKDVQGGTRFYEVVNGNGSGPLAGYTNFQTVGSSPVYITNSLPSFAKFQPQVIFLQNYGGNTITLTDQATSANIPVTLVTGNIYSFTLPMGHTAVYAGYSSAAPFHCSLYVPVNYSAAGQNPTPANTAYCNGTVGATLVEPNVNGSSGDVMDISEVNGVNAQWQVTLPCGWVSGDYKSPNTNLQIPVATIQNHSGPSPTFYGDYGNPGIYPFGCTNCASRYFNEVIATGCNGFFAYPANDVGCNNAINNYPNNTLPFTPPLNAALPSFEHHPPGVAPLPIDSFAPKKLIYNLAHQVPVPNEGYGICQLNRASQCSGGAITIKLLQYPYPLQIGGHH